MYRDKVRQHLRLNAGPLIEKRLCDLFTSPCPEPRRTINNTQAAVMPKSGCDFPVPQVLCFWNGDHSGISMTTVYGKEVVT